jgi:hypothetical protein
VSHFQSLCEFDFVMSVIIGIGAIIAYRILLYISGYRVREKNKCSSN